MEWRRTRLLALAEKHGGNAALGRLLGYKDGAMVGQMLRGERPITEKTVAKAEELPGSSGWFNRPSVPVKGTTVLNLSPAPGPNELAVHVPLLANAGSMGDGQDEMHEDVLVGSIALSPDWITRRLRMNRFNDLRFIHAYGDSMSDTFEDGDILLVDTGAKDPSGADGVYVLEAAHRVFIKRVTERFGGTFEVTSDNPKVKAVDVLDGSNQIQVRGRVIWCWNGKKI